MIDLNIVIVNWKMKNDIERCLKSLFADTKDFEGEVLVNVIDNSDNSDGIKEFLADRYPTVRYHNPGKNLGFGKAQNLGFSAAPAKFYLALNPDIEFLPGSRAIKKMIDFFKANPAVGILGPKLLNLDGSVQSSCCRFPSASSQLARRLNLDKKIKFFKKSIDAYLMSDFDHNRVAPVDWLIGACFMARGEMAERISFFDDRFFMYFEDCDWCRRAWRAGWQVVYLADLVVKHGHRRDSAREPAWISLFTNPVARIHLKSWFKYFWKWGLKVEHFGV